MIYEGGKVQERQAIIAWIEYEVLDRPAPAATGGLMARRLHRAEYVNTVRDLLGVPFQPAPRSLCPGW